VKCPETVQPRTKLRIYFSLGVWEIRSRVSRKLEKGNNRDALQLETDVAPVVLGLCITRPMMYQPSPNSTRSGNASFELLTIQHTFPARFSGAKSYSPIFSEMGDRSSLCKILWAKSRRINHWSFQDFRFQMCCCVRDILRVWEKLPQPLQVACKNSNLGARGKSWLHFLRAGRTELRQILWGHTELSWALHEFVLDFEILQPT